MSKSKVVFVWSTPRSLSTAFERCFKERPDFRIFHEPYAECFHYGPSRKSDRYGETEAKSSYTADEAAARFAATDERVSLVKDLGFQAEPYVTKDQLSDWQNVVLTRHPYSVARSLFKLKPDFLENELGFTVIRKVVDRIGFMPPIIDGDKFSIDPEKTIRRLCSALGVLYLPGFSKWTDGAIKNWSKEEYDAHAKWHGNLHESKGITASNEVPHRDSISKLGLSSEQMNWVDEAVVIYDEISAYAL